MPRYAVVFSPDWIAAIAEFPPESNCRQLGGVAPRAFPYSHTITLLADGPSRRFRGMDVLLQPPLFITKGTSTHSPTPHLQVSLCVNEYTFNNPTHHLLQERDWRYNLWVSRLQHAQTQNALATTGASSLTLTLNAFADLTEPEAAQKSCGPLPKTRVPIQPPTGAVSLGTSFPFPELHSPLSGRQHSFWQQQQRHKRALLDSTYVVNLKAAEYVTEVKNQGSCGDCWIFGGVATTESLRAIANKGLVSLSEQEVLNCSGNFTSDPCSGGFMSNVYSIIMGRATIRTTAQLPYTATVGTCPAPLYSTTAFIDDNA